MDGKSKLEAERGTGSITYDKRNGRFRLRLRVDDKDRSLYFAKRKDAELARRAHAESLNTKIGITLREWGEIWLEEHDFGNSTPSTWRSVVLRSAPFIDYPLIDLTSEDIAGWASMLPTVKRTRSELHNGKQKARHIRRADFARLRRPSTVAGSQLPQSSEESITAVDQVESS